MICSIYSALKSCHSQLNLLLCIVSWKNSGKKLKTKTKNLRSTNGSSQRMNDGVSCVYMLMIESADWLCACCLCVGSVMPLSSPCKWPLVTLCVRVCVSVCLSVCSLCSVSLSQPTVSCSCTTAHSKPWLSYSVLHQNICANAWIQSVKI